MQAMFVLLASTGVSASELALANRLKSSPSPYLSLHVQDPVKWQSWSPETVELARRSGRLLYVSVGYYACHWCHVMQRESYRNPHVAAYLNAHFIPVKVDREINTGLDAALQEFAEQLIHQGGWPLNAFVTPEGYPLSVVLYQPPDEFLRALTRINDAWSTQHEALATMARRVVLPAATLKASQYGAGEKSALLGAFLNAARAEADNLQGGFGDVFKFPHVPQLNLLLAVQASSPDISREKWLRHTLDVMADKGLRDHVYGGFFRYTTDPDWSVPHFEKMLYDNAQLAMLYLNAANVLNEPAYRVVARSALDFMLDDLHDMTSGGFFSSTSAVDEQGREGTAYLWRKDDLDTLLSHEEMSLARRIWQLDQHSPFESGNVLPTNYLQITAVERARLVSIYAKLKASRTTIVIPKDRKMLTGLNGLALSAFSRAASLDARYRVAAQRLYRFMARQWRNDTLHKGQYDRQSLPDAELEDYAYGASGLLDYAHAFNDTQATRLASLWATQAWKRFASPAGWQREKSLLLKSIKPDAVLEDGVVLSPSAVLIDVSLRLRSPLLVSKAREGLAWRSAAMQRDPFAYPTQIGLLQK